MATPCRPRRRGTGGSGSPSRQPTPPRPGEDMSESGAPAARPPVADDLDAVERQLGRVPRAVTAVAHRCPCGLPDVVQTAPRLPDGTPFPTLYYLTCPRACAALSRQEAAGVMRDMTVRLGADPVLRE